jgi:hypothetical protein
VGFARTEVLVKPVPDQDTGPKERKATVIGKWLTFYPSFSTTFPGNFMFLLELPKNL